jgi:transcriptional regulator with XRE-family HTH domain
MANSDSTFAIRLHHAMQLHGVTTNPEKVERLVTATGRSRKTAQRWLSGACRPRHDDALFKIARQLDIDPGWLYDGRGHDPFIHHVVQKMQTLPPDTQSQFARFLNRLARNDAEIVAAFAKFERGELDGHALVAMA